MSLASTCPLPLYCLVKQALDDIVQGSLVRATTAEQDGLDAAAGIDPTGPGLHLAASLARIMRNHPAALLAGIDVPSLHSFLSRCEITRHANPRQIITQGDNLDHAYLVIAGAVEISVMDESGNFLLAHLAQAGEVVGEVELLSRRPCVASATARRGSTLARFGSDVLRAHVPAERLLQNLSGVLHDRLGRDNSLHLTALFYSSEDRIRSHLLRFTTAESPRTDISQSDLATFSGCSRQTVNRTLAQLRDEGILRLARGSITVLDRNRLRQFRALTDKA